NNSFIVSVSTVTSQFVELIKCQADIIQGVRTLRVTRQLRDLPCAEIGKDFARQFYAFFTQTMHFFIDVNIQFLILATYRRQGIDFRFQLSNRLFEIKEIQTHSIPVLVKLQFHLLRTNEATEIVQSTIARRDTPRCTKAQPRTCIRPLIVEMYWNGPRAVGFQRLTESV